MSLEGKMNCIEKDKSEQSSEDYDVGIPVVVNVIEKKNIGLILLCSTK